MSIRAMKDQYPELYADSSKLRFDAAVKAIPKKISYENRMEEILKAYHIERDTVTTANPNDHDKLRFAFISCVGKNFIPPQLSIHSPEYRIYCVALEAYSELVGEYRTDEHEHNYGYRNAALTIKKIKQLIDNTLPGACPDPDGPTPQHNALRRPA